MKYGCLNWRGKMDFTVLACAGIVCDIAYVAADMVKCRPSCKYSCNEVSSTRQFIMLMMLAVTFGVSYSDAAEVDRFHFSLQLLFCPLQHTSLHIPPV
jgi:hypothetical protein